MIKDNNIYKLDQISEKIIIVHHHLGLGDHIICNGLVNKLSEGLDTIYLPVKSHYYEMIKYLYLDNNKIKLFQVTNNNSEDDVLVYAKKNNLRILRIGFEKVKKNPFNTWFYEQLNYPYEYSFDYFKLPDQQTKGEQLEEHLCKYYSVNKNNYILVHNQSHENTYELKNITSKDVIYMSKDSDLFSNMFYYKKLITNAKEIHCINSSFLHLVERVKTDSKLYYHKVRNSNFKLNEKWNVVNYDN